MSIEKNEDFNLIKRDLVDRVGKLETNAGGAWTKLAIIENQMIDMKERMDRHSDLQKSIHIDIKGYMQNLDILINGKDGKPGMAADVYILKQHLMVKC